MFMLRVTSRIFLALALLVWADCSVSSQDDTEPETYTLTGHLDILGKHRPPDGHIEILDHLPSPEEFWEKYAKDGVPVMFRGMADNYAAKEKWTDSYLLEHYGDLRVKIEAKSEKEYYPEGDRGIGQDTLRYFLETYHARNAYVVSQLPDPMSKEVFVPPFLTCGTFSQRLLEANLWFSNGGTKSLLHRDADNNINCLFFGSKDWIFIDPKYEDLIPVAMEATEGYGGFAVLNPDSVDLKKFPKVADIPWSYANVTAGDCIFLPRSYWHQVRSYGSRNLAVTILFSRLQEIDLSGCEGVDLSYRPLSEMEMVFTYDGFSEQSMGETDPFELNETLQDWCSRYGPSLNRQALYNGLVKDYNRYSEDNENEIGASFMERDADFLNDVADQVVQTLDRDNDGELSCREELRGLNVSTLKALAHIIDPDPANTEEYEYAKFDPEEISEFLEGLVREHESKQQTVISRAAFVDAYKQLGGSQKIGNEVFSEITDSNEVTLSLVQENAEQISALFSLTMKQEFPDVRWLKEKNNWKTEEEDNHIHTEL